VNHNELFFAPPRRPGLFFHGGVIIGLGLLGVWNLWQMTEASIGPVFLRHFLVSMFALLPLPLLLYRFRALQRAQYILERDGIRLRWGFRAVDIPMDQVQWVYPQEDLLTSLPKPWIYWPGSVLGTSLRPLQGATKVEYMAATVRKLVLIGTSELVYAISPQDRDGFLSVYHRMIELGSLSPIAPRSERPAYQLLQMWQILPVRFLFISTLGLSLVLFIWVSLEIPGRQGVVMGAAGSIVSQDLLPAAALLLLPFLNSVFLVASWLLGVFFFRDEKRRALAYLLWGGSLISSFLFLISLAYILSVS
jgi:hypothetical protein